MCCVLRLCLTMRGRTQIDREGSVAFNNRLVGITASTHLSPPPPFTLLLLLHAVEVPSLV